jgi:hypothetical protein
MIQSLNNIAFDSLFEFTFAKIKILLKTESNFRTKQNLNKYSFQIPVPLNTILNEFLSSFE